VIRIIAGTAKGLRLRVPRGQRVRPTGARVRESLFSILGEGVVGARVLDLFAGSGALGIEALSRGAEACWFVERSRPALAALEENLTRAGLEGRATIVRGNALAAADLLDAEARASLALIDPPYDLLRRRMRRFVAFLAALADSPGVVPSALLVVQHDAKTPLPDQAGPLRASDVRTYGMTRLSFLERPLHEE
jgi:16S rRNA (guanine(966)-N(2))-methyltransferase RsmD